MAKQLAEIPPAPVWTRGFLLLLIPVIASLIYWDGQQYDSDLLSFEGDGQYSATSNLFPAALQNLDRFAQVREYDKDNLYEYINGHAEFFISAGFRGLAVGEYAPAGAAAPTLVINLYDMGKSLHAFGVLIDESSGESAEVGAMGFVSEQGVNFIIGQYYAQVSVFDTNLSALDAARSVADFIGDHVKQGGLAFDFPQLGEVDTTRFIKEYYRGMEFFNNILERKFQYGDKQISAFLTTNKTPERTRTALLEFLETDGIAVEIHQVEGVKFYQVDDPYEGQWFFVPLAEQLLGVYAPLDDTLQQHILTFAQQNTS